MTQATRACAHCGQQYQRRGAKYCTPLCGSRAYNKRRAADGRLSQYNNDPEVKARFYAWKQDNAERYMVERTCIVCDSTWMTQRKDAKYCTLACRDAAPKPKRTWTRQQKARRRATAASRGTRGTRWISGPCHRCGSQFAAKASRSLPRWCSQQCADLDKHDKRKAMIRKAFVEDVRRYVVFERDNWTCHICKEPIDAGIAWPDPNSATVDHVFPLARGGEHSMANVRAAHFRCNLIKSDSVIKA